jgi:hypothetical protein
MNSMPADSRASTTARTLFAIPLARPPLASMRFSVGTEIDAERPSSACARPAALAGP